MYAASGTFDSRCVHSPAEAQPKLFAAAGSAATTAAGTAQTLLLKCMTHLQQQTMHHALQQGATLHAIGKMLQAHLGTQTAWAETAGRLPVLRCASRHCLAEPAFYKTAGCCSRWHTDCRLPEEAGETFCSLYLPSHK